MFDGSQDGGSAPLPEMGDLGGHRSFFQKIFSKKETTIPVILIIILIIVLIFAFSGWDYSQVPLIGGPLQSAFGAKTYRVLIIGQPLPQAQDYIYGKTEFTMHYNFDTMNEDQFEYNPGKILSRYNFVILDQSASETQMGQLKAIPRELTQALLNYVSGGHSLIIVGNSGHTEAGFPDNFGWEAMFKGKVPVNCKSNVSILSPCDDASKIPINAIIRNTQANNVVFYGIDQVPAKSYLAKGTLPLELTVYPVNRLGDEWAEIQDVRTKKTYAGIVANGSFLGGKVVYISYEEYYQTPVLMMDIFNYIR